jgi:hypothetical protein
MTERTSEMAVTSGTGRGLQRRLDSEALVVAATRETLGSAGQGRTGQDKNNRSLPPPLIC